MNKDIMGIIAREKERYNQFQKQQQSQGQFDPQKLAGGVLSGDISSSDITALQSMGVIPQQQEDNIASLFELRKQAEEAGRDTSLIDQQLAQKGFAPSQEGAGDEELELINLIQDIKGLKPGLAALTGPIRGSFDPARLFTYGKTEEARGKLQRLNALLQLAEAGKLKGQGPISGGEREILRQAASNLNIDEKGQSSLKRKDFLKGLEELEKVLAKKGNIDLSSQGVTSQDDTTNLVNKYWK
jgi:hypothetical protein